MADNKNGVVEKNRQFRATFANIVKVKEIGMEMNFEKTRRGLKKRQTKKKAR